MFKNYRLPLVIIASQSIALHWLSLIINFCWSINKAFYIICDSLVFAHQNVVSIHVNDKRSNFFIVKVITLTNRSHVILHFFSNRTQMTLKCVKEKWHTDVLTMFWHLLWSITKQMYSNMESQRAKKVVSDSPGLVDFAIRLVNSVFNLPDGQVTFFEEFK